MVGIIVETVKIIYIGHDHGHDHHLHHDHHPHLLSIELYEGQHPLLGAELALVIHVLQHIDCHDDHFCSHDDCDFDEDADCYHDFYLDDDRNRYTYEDDDGGVNEDVEKGTDLGQFEASPLMRRRMMMMMMVMMMMTTTTTMMRGWHGGAPRNDLGLL